MSAKGLGRNDPCPCCSSKKYKKCCYPRTFPNFSLPNAGLPDPFEQREAVYRAMARHDAQRPHDVGATINTVDVGRTRLLCAPLPRYGDGVALPGTLAPPTPLQIEDKYQAIRNGNPEGVTEVVVSYTYAEPSGQAEARMLFDADERFELLGGQVVGVLDLFRGMRVVMADGTVGTLVGNPEWRYDIPVPPLPDEDGLWSSRVVGRVRHTAYEVVQFRWAGQTVDVTPGHVVWSASRRGWVGADELRQGELIRVANNVVAPVEGVRRLPGVVEVFGIEVEHFHNYFVGAGPDAMLVHNGPECVVKPAILDEAVPARMRNFHADADLLLERLGPASRSHPEEHARIMADLEAAGVEIAIRPGTLAYSPSRGNPGRMILDPETSIGALRHEYQHFIDHRTAEFPGFRPYFENPGEFARLEARGYMREIQTARETGHVDLVPAITQQMRVRVRELMGGH